MATSENSASHNSTTSQKISTNGATSHNNSNVKELVDAATIILQVKCVISVVLI